MVIRLPGGANSGGSGGGGAPSGSAGGSLTGTYPNPTIATIPSGATATTQTAADGSTKVATTAYVDTADALKANLAGPTFTGVVTLPTGTVATTQSAADGSTKLATTAYVDTAGALKANLAGPTFTGVVTLPTGTVATTQSAADNSTKLATTAYTDTGLALKANLASPTFSGTPSLPTGTTATTQSASDNSTKLATTAYADASINAGSAKQLGLHTYASIDPAAAAGSVLAPNSGDGRFITVTIGETGFIRDLSVLVKLNQAVNMSLMILDTGQANGTHTVRTCKAVSSASAMGSAGAWFTYDADLACTVGDTFAFGVIIQGTSGSMVGSAGVTGLNVFPTTSFLPSSGAGTTNQKYGFTVAAANIPTLNNTVTDANCTTANVAIPLFVWRIAAS